MEEQRNHHTVHRIVLPSGRKIEVVRFVDPDSAPCRPLHICGNCHAPLVQPLSWSETGDEHWELELGCPNCEWTTTGTYSQAEVEELEDRLEEGLSEMLADLQRLAQANMSDEIDRFVTALSADMILPEDF
ncbi:MAG: hypothetical protein JO244_06270 [Solirubrobacterales bacterium]|nr:hypothetical protein [Solirubrobacterales bacterium]